MPAALTGVIFAMPFRAVISGTRLLAAALCLQLWSASAGAGEQEWQVLTVLGEAALQQKNFTLAEKQLAAALDEADDFGSGDPRLGRSLNNLATARNALGRTEAAEPLLRQALEIWRADPAGHELQLATTLHHLAGIAHGKGERQAAMASLRQALALREKALPADHAALARTRKSIATLERAPTPLARARSAEAKPATRATSGFVLHLASLQSDAQARREWRRLRQAFPELLGELALTLEPVDLGTRGVYQRILSGPFEDRAAAGQACARLKAKQQYCQVVKAKDG